MHIVRVGVYAFLLYGELFGCRIVVDLLVDFGFGLLEVWWKFAWNRVYSDLLLRLYSLI